MLLLCSRLTYPHITNQTNGLQSNEEPQSFRFLIFKLRGGGSPNPALQNPCCKGDVHLHSTWNKQQKLARRCFGGAPSSLLQLGHEHNSASFANNRWLERCKLQAHAQQKEKRYGGKVDLHSCLPASGVVSHADTQLLPPLSEVTFTLCASLTRFRAEGGVQKTSDHRMSDSTPLHLHSSPLCTHTLFLF